MDKRLEQWLMEKKEADHLKAAYMTDPYVSDNHDQFSEYRTEDDTMDEYFDEVLLKGVDEREPQY